MKSFAFEIPLVALVALALGLGGGWMLFRAPHEQTEEEAHEDHAEETRLAPETLENLGVSVGELALTDYRVTRDVPARLARVPFAEIPVHAPLGGVVQDVLVEPGEKIAPGRPLVRWLREAIPLPRLSLTERVVKPDPEALHEAVMKLRATREELAIQKAELERVEGLNAGNEGEVPIISGQRTIDLGYAVRRAARAHTQARHELEKHGFGEEQITAIGEGAPLPNRGREIWLRALERNGLWTATCRRLLAALPEHLADSPWVLATVAELDATGLLTEAFMTWITGHETPCGHFLEIAHELQAGRTPEEIAALHDAGAFDAVVVARAPDSSPLDVLDVAVRPGDRVASGARLLTLQGLGELHLHARPTGRELASVLDAAREGNAQDARPLVPGTGPRLQDLVISQVREDPDSGHAEALLRVANRELTERTDARGRTFRTWAMRPGHEYVLEVPVRHLEKVYVVPAEAVTREGPDRVVLLQDGGTFRPTSVRVLRENDREVVLAGSGPGSLFPGDTIAMSGAYALLFAVTEDAGGAVDPHHGHSH